MTTKQDDDSSPTESAAEILVLTIKECFVYKVPPLRSASGHRAEDWSLAAPLCTGCMQLLQSDTRLRIVLYAYKDENHTAMSGENVRLVGECPVEIQPGESITQCVDGVVDSSRYYVLRLKDPKSSRSTLIGVGFRERDTALDFKNALNEYVRFVERMRLADRLAHSLSVQDEAEGAEESGNSAVLSDKDQALLHLDEHITPLREGEKIKVKLNVGKKSQQREEEGQTNSSIAEQQKPAGSATKGFALKPPPPAGSLVHVSFPASGAAPFTAPTVCSAPAAPAETESEQVEDEDWGDFTSS